jgi:hypothetical protein
MNKKEAKKLHNGDEVILKKSFDGKKRVLKVCGISFKGDLKSQYSYVELDLFDENGNFIKDVNHKFLK